VKVCAKSGSLTSRRGGGRKAQSARSLKVLWQRCSTFATAVCWQWCNIPKP